MTNEEYDALPGLTDEQEDEVADFIMDRYGSLIDNLTDEAVGCLNVVLNAKAKAQVKMHMECTVLTMLKEEYEEEEKKEEMKEEMK